MIVGRSRELGLLDRALDEAAGGTAARVLVVGAAGIGKTALVDAAAARAATRGFRVLRATGLQGDRALPFAVVADLVRSAGPAVLRELSDADAEVLRGLATGTQASAARVGAALLQLVAVLAETGPVCVAVDDVHWADPWSRQALALAAGRLLVEPVAVLVTTRPVDLDDPDLVRWPLLELGPLPETDALALLRASVEVVVPDGVGHRLVAALGGNPLALRECGRFLPEADLTGTRPLPDPLPISAALRAGYARAVDQLPERAARALLAVAVVGQGGGDLLARVLDASELTMGDLDPAVAAGLLQIDPERGPVSVHPLARSAVYLDADPATRRAIHRRTADAASAMGLATDLAVAHLVRSMPGPDEPTAAAVEREARRAVDAGLPRAAASAFDVAARLSPEPAARADRWVAAARTCAAAGVELDDPGPLVEFLADADLGVEDSLFVNWMRADLLSRSDLRASALARLEQAERIGSLDRRSRAWSLWGAAKDAHHAGEAEIALRAAEELSRLIAGYVGEQPPEFVGLGPGVLGHYAVFAGEVARGVPLLQRALAEVDRASDEGMPPWIATVRLFVLDTVIPRRCPERDRRLDRLVERIARDDTAHLAFMRGVQADRLRQQGRWAAARADVDEAAEIGSVCGDRVGVAQALAVGVLLDALTGDHDRLAAEAGELRGTCAALGDRYHVVLADRAEGLLALAEGRLDDAVQRLTAVADVGFCGHGTADSAMPAQVDLVEALQHAGEHAAAVRRMQRVEEWFVPMPDPLSAALLARARALVAEDSDQADQLFRQALTQHAEATDPFEDARTRLQFAEHLRRTQRRTSARHELLTAAATFQQLGAPPWLDRAEAELRACGVPSAHREPFDAAAQLTAQERRVAEAVADGRSNREVAAALFLSPRTVEYHLGNAYRKLAVTNRTALADRLREAS